MKRILILLCFTCCLGCSSKKESQSKTSKPNVLFIIVDDLRTELNTYGDNQIISPNIDALASQGLQFNRAYCQVPVCGASRASLLSGLRPTRERFLKYNSSVDEDAPGIVVLPQIFKENGYYTISNGKVFHIKNDSEERSWSEPIWQPEYINGRKYLDPDSENYIGGIRNRGPFFESPDVPDNAYPDGQILDKSIADLKRLSKKDQPFFLTVGFTKPHLPFYAPKKYWDLYNRDSIEIAQNKSLPENTPASLIGSEEIKFYHGKNIEYNSDEFHRTARHGYYACISYTDALIGHLLSTLDSLNLRDNTIVVLIGDHGWNLGELNFWSKHNTMHNSMNAPLIVNAPGYLKNKKSEALVEFLDIYPTLCDLANIKLPSHLAGKSFVPLLKNPVTEWKHSAFSRYETGDAVITERYTLTHYLTDSLEEYMLYDLEKDPQENINVVDKKEYEEIANQMKELLKEGYPSK